MPSTRCSTKTNVTSLRYSPFLGRTIMRFGLWHQAVVYEQHSRKLNILCGFCSFSVSNETKVAASLGHTASRLFRSQRVVQFLGSSHSWKYCPRLGLDEARAVYWRIGSTTGVGQTGVQGLIEYLNLTTIICFLLRYNEPLPFANGFRQKERSKFFPEKCISKNALWVTYAFCVDLFWHRPFSRMLFSSQQQWRVREQQ